MYVVTPSKRGVRARPDTGGRARGYRPENSQRAVGEACCDVVNRGATYADGVLYTMLDVTRCR
jgi:alcohol dehydrogenase (cytochrome c)